MTTVVNDVSSITVNTTAVHTIAFNLIDLSSLVTLYKLYKAKSRSKFRVKN